MKKLLTAILLACALTGAASAATILSEGFEGSFPPAGWTQNSIDQSSTYAHIGTYSARFTAAGDYLITSGLSSPQTLVFWFYPTSSAGVIVETASSTNGPWTAVSGSPYSGGAATWNEQSVSLSSSGIVYVQFKKTGTGYLYIDDVSATNNGASVSNTPPVLATIGSQSITVSNALNFAVTATDADHDSIVLSASNLPPGAIFNTTTNAGSVSNTFNWASAAPVGVYTTTFYAVDGTTNDFETITITVTNSPVVPANNPPVLASIGSKALTLSNALNFTVSATDADNDPIVLSASNLPPGAVFNTTTNAGSVSNIFNWASAAPVGVYTTTFYAVDSTTNDFETITITVTNTPVSNPLAVINVETNQYVPLGANLEFYVGATSESSGMFLSATNIPSGASFSVHYGSHNLYLPFRWNAASPAGTYPVTFICQNSGGITQKIVYVHVVEPASITESPWQVSYNLPQQSGSGTAYPNQFLIRDALVERINELRGGYSAVLSSFTFSAEEGAGVIMNAMSAALDRGAEISFIADGDINIGTVYGGTNSLLDLSNRSTNPLDLEVDGSTSGIMHDKLGLFDYGGSNQWVFVASWNFTLSASANQWNIAVEARSPSLYNIYKAETDEMLAGRFHDDPLKSHAHDGSTFTLDGSWGTNFARFAPYPDDTQGGNNAERDITNLIAQAQGEIVFALNKLNREPIRDALIAAADRGVIIRGVMPRSDTDTGNVSAAVYSYLTNSANYATTNMVQCLPAYAEADYSALDDGTYSDLIHAKYMVIDPQSSNAIVIHGSANWTAEALVNNNDNDENVIFLRHNDIAAEFYEHFQRITASGVYSEGNSTLVSWDFQDHDPIADGGIAANATQTVIRIPAPSGYAYTYDSLSCSGWQDGSGTKYWETSFSTEEHTDIKVSSVQTASGTGPSDFKLQYKTSAAGTYTDVPYSDVHVPDGGNGVLTRVLLPDTCNNQTNVFLCWIMTSDTSARGYDNVQSGGRGSIDDIVITGTAYNQPPVLDPVGDQNVFEGQTLTFSVTASDPIDGDSITLGAANLPTGSVFTNGTFIWSNAAPAGIYSVTFYATDKDGSENETISITVSERPRLLISEIADPAGTGGDAYRFIELYNAGDTVIDLDADQWYLSKQVNGGTWYNIALTGTVADASTRVIAYSAADFQSAYGFAPDQESGSVSGNGDDAYFLYYGGDHASGLLIDIYGEFDTDGTDTAWDYEDSRATRKNAVLEPTDVWTASEWDIESGATTNDMTPGAHGPLPQFPGLDNAFAFLGDDLSLTITAVNTVRTDVINLSASTLPAGAVFPAATGTNTVSSTLTWNSPTAGTYTVTFDAAGEVGTTTESILITVASGSRIDGRFYGWSGDTIFKLDNGQFWQQSKTGSKTVSPAKYRPDIIITNYLRLERRMTVEDVSGYVVVEQINVDESIVTNSFSGLHNGNIYQLADGTFWKQISFENISSSADPVAAWRWMDGGVQKIRFLDNTDVVIGTCIVEPAGPSADTTVHSKIDGYFRGWKYKRVFALANGQFWQQTDLDSSVETLYRPNVTVTNWLQTGNWRMKVEGAATPPAWVDVQQIAGVTRTSVDGWFYGFGNDEILHLADGSWWQQTSSGNSASTRYNPEILLWNENDMSYLELPDEGLRITAEQLAVHLESTVTNAFTGLHYGNLYRLDGNGDWLQASFENIRSGLTLPDVMLWVEGALTNMLVRSDSDENIGICTVVDPILDADNDGINNRSETIAGTDVFDAQSKFKVTQTERSAAGRYILHWNAAEGRLYTIQWTPDLSQPFQTLENNIAYPQNSWTDTVHTVESKGYYRIGVQLAE